MNSNAPLTAHKHKPVVVFVILGCILNIYFLHYVFESPVYTWGSTQTEVAQGNVWQLFTSLFAHANFRHIFFNSILLLILGIKAERIYGPWKFTLIYLAAGIGGGLLSHWFREAPVSVGASGAIFGLLAALIVYFYRYREQLGKTAEKELGYALGLLFANIIYGFLEPNVDYLAHFGGLFTGGGVAYILLSRPLANSKWSGRLFQQETDLARRGRMQTAAFILFTVFVVEFRFFLEAVALTIRYQSDSDREPVYVLFYVIIFIAALELWRGNKNAVWLSGFVLVFTTFNIIQARTRIKVADMSALAYIASYILANISLNISLLVVFIGKPAKLYRPAAALIFIMGYLPFRLWPILAAAGYISPPSF